MRVATKPNALVGEKIGWHAEPGTALAPPRDMVRIDGGRFMMGSDRHYPEERPQHEVSVDPFLIDRCPVTNAEFGRFVHETGHVTVAERVPGKEMYPGAKQENLVPASIVFRSPETRVDCATHFNWWAYERGANWRHPQGPRSTLRGKLRHPVVHVAYEDALAYAQWARKDLPTEAEWEFAARGGLDGADYAWGDEFMPGGLAMANTWHGEFPYFRHNGDDSATTSPVGMFPPNGYGLYDMIGNVWEWTGDWYAPGHRQREFCCAATPDSRADESEASIDPSTPDIKVPRRVMKGGSWLCAPNYCRRYRPAARMAQAVDTSTCHLGFRCVVRPLGSGSR